MYTQVVCEKCLVRIEESVLQLQFVYNTIYVFIFIFYILKFYFGPL